MGLDISTKDFIVNQIYRVTVFFVIEFSVKLILLTCSMAMKGHSLNKY